MSLRLGWVLGVHGLHGGDILQLDWCGPCRLYAFVRVVGKRGVQNRVWALVKMTLRA
jgi:hypothetical protein